MISVPTDVQGAEALKEICPDQFAWWAVDLVNARRANMRCGSRVVDY
jgi:hypothetical protein